MQNQDSSGPQDAQANQTQANQFQANQPQANQPQVNQPQANQPQTNQMNFAQPQLQFNPTMGLPPIQNMPQFTAPNNFQFNPAAFPAMPTNLGMNNTGMNFPPLPQMNFPPPPQMNFPQQNVLPFPSGQPGMMPMTPMQPNQQGMMPMQPGMMSQSFGMKGIGQIGQNMVFPPNTAVPQMGYGNMHQGSNIHPPALGQPGLQQMSLNFLQTQDASQKFQPQINQNIETNEDYSKKTIEGLNKKIKEKDQALNEQADKIEEQEKEKMTMANKIKNLENKLKRQQDEIEEQKNENQAQLNKLQQEQKINKEKYEQKIQLLNQQIINLQNDHDDEIQKLRSNPTKQKQQDLPSYQNEFQQQQLLKEAQDTIKKQKQQIEVLSQQLKDKTRDLEQAVIEQEDAQKKSKDFQINNDTLKNAFQDIQKRFQQKQEEFQQYQYSQQRDSCKLINKVKDLQNEIQKLEIENQSCQNIKDILVEELKKSNQRIQQIQESQNDIQIVQNLIKINDQNAEQQRIKIEAIENQKNKRLAQMLQQEKEEKEKQQALNDKGIAEKMKLIGKLGKIQCCFFMDLYKTNKKVKQSLLQGIDDALYELKGLTGREFSVASHCYGYRKKKSTIPATQPFTQNTAELLKNLQQQELEEFIDQPEDIKTSLILAKNFLWKEKFRLAILIANSPCHGKKFHDPKKYFTWFIFSKDYDKNPNDDITQAVDQLIQMDIVLLMIRVNDDTKVMCNELEKIYSAKKKSHMFFVVSIKNAYDIKDKILKFAGSIIGTDNKSTKTKTNQVQRQAYFQEGIEEMSQIKDEVVKINKEVEKLSSEKKNGQNDILVDVSSTQAEQDKIQYEAQIERIKNQDGALQALCKRGDISQFEKRVETVKFRCQVFKVDLKEQSFKAKKENIEQILYEKGDYIEEPVNQWECIRTKHPFAFGMVKEVYLMKKNGVQDEIYVVKIPIDKGCYKSMKDAINDCRCHLVAKNLMKIFMDKIREKNQGLPQVVYTDFLLLEEAPNKIWLAERFFKGEFEKYNNNDGYVNELDSPLNQIAQAFSYFTYQEGGFNYIVNDIQGVNNYFTDPAINTTKGGLDETDAGEEGMSNFLGSLQVKKHLCEKLLKSIDVEMD